MKNNSFSWFSVCIYLITLSPAASLAQENDILFTLRSHPSSKYVPPLDSTSKIGSSRQLEYALSAHVGLSTRIDTVTGNVKAISGTVFGKYTRLSNSGFNELILPDELYAIGTGVSYYSTMNARWAYTLFLNAALNTDFIAVDYNDLFLTGGVQFIRNFSPNFRMGFGVIIHNNLGKPMFWPAVSVYWNFGRRFNFDIRVPDEGYGLAYKIGVGYQYSKNLSLAFAFKPQTISYDVELKDAINNRLMNYWELPFELSGTYHAGRLEYTGILGFTALRSFAYAEKDIKNMFTKYPYHGLRTNLTYGLTVRFKF